MWILTPHNEIGSEVEEERIQSQNLEQTLRKSFLLLPDADNVVGRMPKAASSSVRPLRPIVILEQSISGTHALLTFDRQASNGDPEIKIPVTLTDKSSFGTWVNGEKVHRANVVRPLAPLSPPLEFYVHGASLSLLITNLYIFPPNYIQCLKEGDLIEFGGNRLVKYRLCHRPLVVTISAVTGSKEALIAAVAKLGG